MDTNVTVTKDKTPNELVAELLTHIQTVHGLRVHEISIEWRHWAKIGSPTPSQNFILNTKLTSEMDK